MQTIFNNYSGGYLALSKPIPKVTTLKVKISDPQ
jgi:hypothetical protein